LRRFISNQPERKGREGKRKAPERREGRKGSDHTKQQHSLTDEEERREARCRRTVTASK